MPDKQYGMYPKRTPKPVNGFRKDGLVEIYRLGVRGGVKEHIGVYRYSEAIKLFSNITPIERGYLKGRWIKVPDTYGDSWWRYQVNYPKSSINDAIKHIHHMTLNQAYREITGDSIK